MDRVLGLVHTAMFCTTLIGMGLIVGLAFPGSNLPSLIMSLAKWCEAAINAVKKSKKR